MVDYSDYLIDMRKNALTDLYNSKPPIKPLTINSLADDTVGRIMKQKVVVALPDWTCGGLREDLTGNKDIQNDFNIIIVVDEKFKLLGEIRLSYLLVAPDDKLLSEAMTTIQHKITMDMDQEDAALIFRRYKLAALPVIDDKEHLVGAIGFDDIIKVVDEEAEEDLGGLAGVTDVSMPPRLLDTVRGRSPWLFVNLSAAMVASFEISFFEDTLEKFIALAVLLPIVASMGGNAGTQTVTVVVRALALKQLTPGRAKEYILREAGVGLFNGFMFAGVTGVISLFWFGSVMVAAVMALAMICNMMLAALCGTAIPLTLNRIGIDPAIASSVFITTVTDIFGFLIFLSLGTLILT